MTQQVQRLDDFEQRMVRAWRHLLSLRRSLVSEAQRRLWQASPIRQVRDTAARHAALVARLNAAELAQLRRIRERLLPLVRTLNAVSPLATLERGYAIVSTEDGKILRDAAQVKPGAVIEARLAVGRLRAKVDGRS